MATQKKKKQTTSDKDPFQEALRQVLNNFDDLAHLEAESPLAQPYFLGRAVLDPPNSQYNYPLAEALRQEIMKAAATFWDGPLPPDRESFITLVEAERRQLGNKGGRYHYLLLELRYFRQYFRPNATPDPRSEQAIIDYLGVGRSPYFRHLKAAREKLGNALLERRTPTLRLELPPVHTSLIGHQSEQTALQAALRDQQNVMISGPSGSGKTALLAQGISRFESSGTAPIFWYTFRPGINLQTDALLFSMGAFLQQHIRSTLWLQLIADNGELKNFDLALGLLRGDLGQIQKSRFMFCFDDVQHLVSEVGADGLVTQQINTIIDTLLQQSGCQVLLSGQQPIFKADLNLVLSPYTLEEIRQLLGRFGIPAAEEEIARLMRLTAGSPRLLALLPLIHQPEDRLHDTLLKLAYNPTVQGIFNQVWGQLSTDEREICRRLSVYEQPAPMTGWPTEPLARLLHAQLVFQDAQGGIYLLPFWQKEIYADRSKLSAEDRDRFHVEAATRLATLGAYTEATHHLIQAGEFNLGIWLWYPHREQELRRGQAGVARDLFEKFSSQNLDQDEKLALVQIRGELSQLSGDARTGLEILESVRWPDDAQITLEAEHLRAQFLDALGYSEQALTQFGQLQAHIERTLDLLGSISRHYAFTHLRQGNLDSAESNAQKMSFEATYLEAAVESARGNFEGAVTRLENAFELAESIHFLEGSARAATGLSEAYLRLGKPNKGIESIEQAIELYQQIGNRLLEEQAKVNLTGILFSSGQVDQGIKVATASLEFFEQANMPYWISAISSQLAEAYFLTDRLEEAERYANKTLTTEEPHATPFALFTLGQIYLKQEMREKAGRYFEQGITSARESGDRFIEAFHIRGAGQVAAASNQIETARQRYETAIKMFSEMGIESEIEATQALITSLT